MSAPITSGKSRKSTLSLSYSVIARPAWDLHWEVHNLISPSRLATAGLSDLRNSTEYALLGHFDTLAQCQRAAQAPTRPQLHSFTYWFPSHRKPTLRGACFGIFSSRWEPAITGDAASGRLLCVATQEYVQLQATDCPSPYESDAEQPRHSDAAIVVLAAGGSRSVAAGSTVMADLKNLFDHYHLAASADILVFHDGSIAPGERRRLRSKFATLSTVLLGRELWRKPIELALTERFFKQGYTDTLGPRDTARWLGFRFWTLLVFQEARRRGYGWVLRLGRGSRMISRATQDLFAVMKAQDAAYGFRLMGCEMVRRADFFRLIQRALLQQGIQPRWLLDGCVQRVSVFDYHRENCGVDGMLPGVFQARTMMLLPCCVASHQKASLRLTLLRRAQADFFIGNVTFFTQPAVVRFLDLVVDQSGAIWRFNWHEGFWHTAVARIFAPRNRVMHFDDWTHEIAAAHPSVDRPASDEPIARRPYVDAGTGDSDTPRIAELPFFPSRPRQRRHQQLWLPEKWRAVSHESIRRSDCT